MTPPCPRSTIAPAAAWLSRITAVTSTSSIACSCSTSLSRNGFFSPKPALLTSRSTGRSRSATRASTVRELRRGRRGRRRSTSTATPCSVRSSAATSSSRCGVPGHEHEVVPAAGELVGEGTCRCRPWDR